MLERLAVPFRDASASQLVWELDAAPEPWLARRTVVLRAEVRLELRLLGASHQVLVERADGGAVCSELVACRPRPGGALPAEATAERDGVGYRFSSRIDYVAADELAARAERLLRRATSGDPERLLVGAFPGSPHAVTAISVSETGWRTWHVYPQTGEIVTTETVLDVRATSAGETAAGEGR